MNLIKSAAFEDFIAFKGVPRNNWTIDDGPSWSKSGQNGRNMAEWSDKGLMWGSTAGTILRGSLIFKISPKKLWISTKLNLTYRDISLTPDDAFSPPNKCVK